MKLILIATKEEKLLQYASELKTNMDEISLLEDYVFGTAEFEALKNKLELYGEIVIVSGLSFGSVNSQVMRLFELLKDQKVTLKAPYSVFLVPKSDDFDADLSLKFIENAAKELNFSLKTVKVIESNQVKTNEQIVPKQGKNEVTIYTDGACSGNPGAGGWGAVLIHGSKQKEISGYEAETTNNKMELTAVIKALEMLKQPCSVEVFSDSAYVVNAILQGWLENWKKNNWLGADKKPVKNQELWQKLDFLLSKHQVHFNKVKGHSTDELNNRCDALATGEIAKHQNA